MRRPLIELVLVILTGIGHVALEVATSGLKGAADTLNRPQHIYNLTVALLWGGYLVWRLLRTPGLAYEWGFRRQGLGQALGACLRFGVIATIPLVAYAAWQGRLPLPATFWLVVALYPLWGLAQQFALQSLLTRNLRQVVPRFCFRILAAAAIFSAAHFPNYELMGLTLVAGVAFTWLYEKYGNLWAVGITHGFLGALAYYAVLGQNPGAEILAFLHRIA
jgi:membrane protease YdiL (CAAX protease family)